MRADSLVVDVPVGCCDAHEAARFGLWRSKPQLTCPLMSAGELERRV